MSVENSSLLDLYDNVDEECWKVDKKLKKVLSSISGASYNYIEIHPLNWKLDEKDNFILATMITDNHANKKSITDKLKEFNEKNKSLRWDDPFYKNIKWRVDRLVKKNFIVKVDAIRMKNLKRDIPYYKLSLNGIIYSILNWYHDAFLNINPDAMLISILKNYPDCALLRHFLYPYFEKEILENASADLNYRLLEYLYEICKVIIEIKRNSKMHRFSSIEGKETYPFFTWPSPKEPKPNLYKKYFERNSNFRNLLYRELNWSWINDASIDPQFEHDKIIIKSPFLKYDAVLKIDREKKSVKLVFGKEKYSSFKAIVNRHETIDVVGKSIIYQRESLDEILRYSCYLKTIEMIFSIKTKREGDRYILYESVKNDKKFRASVKSLIDILK